jgi:ribosomal protein S18 acetylase RimI-like enzyme
MESCPPNGEIVLGLHDEQQILQCLAQAFAPYRDSYTPEGFMDTVVTPEAFRKRFIAMRMSVATDNSGSVVETIAYKAGNGEGHIRGIAVKPQWHGSEIAKRLLVAYRKEL